MKTFLLNVFKITQDARFDWKHFLNIHKIAEEMKENAGIVFQTFTMKYLINSAYKMCKQHR